MFFGHQLVTFFLAKVMMVGIMTHLDFVLLLLKCGLTTFRKKSAIVFFVRKSRLKLLESAHSCIKEIPML